MKSRRLLSCVLLVLLLVFSLAPAAFAEVVFADENESLTGEHDATVFLAGSDPTSTANIKGILFAAGNSVSANGESEYAFLAGNMVALNSACSRDAFMAGNSVGFSGSVARDLYAAGNTLSLRGTVGRDLYAAGRTISLGGEIFGDVVLDADVIQLSDTLMIDGTLRYNSSAKITGPKNIIESAVTFDDHRAEGNGSVSAPEAPSPLSRLKSRLFSCIGLLLIAYFLLWLTPLWEKTDSAYADADFGKYAASFGIGIAVLLALPIAAVLLMFTGFGLRPAFVLLLVYAAALAASPIFLGFFLGALLWRKLLKRARNYWVELAIGILVCRLLSMLPYISFVFGLISAGFGLGVLTRMLGKKKSAPPALVEQNPQNI